MRSGLDWQWVSPLHAVLSPLDHSHSLGARRVLCATLSGVPAFLASGLFPTCSRHGCHGGIRIELRDAPITVLTRPKLSRRKLLEGKLKMSWLGMRVSPRPRPLSTGTAAGSHDAPCRDSAPPHFSRLFLLYLSVAFPQRHQKVKWPRPFSHVGADLEF